MLEALVSVKDDGAKPERQPTAMIERTHFISTCCKPERSSRERLPGAAAVRNEGNPPQNGSARRKSTLPRGANWKIEFRDPSHGEQIRFECVTETTPLVER